MQKVIFMQGIPGSGKSTMAQHLKEELSNAIIISKDDIRAMHDMPWSRVYERLVDNIQRESVIYALKLGYDVIIDNTHMTKNSISAKNPLIAELMRVSKFIEFEWLYMTMKTPVITCIKRNAARKGNDRVPDTRMQNFISMDTPKFHEVFKEYVGVKKINC